MEEQYTPSDYALRYIDEIRKDYRKMRENCARFEREHRAFCKRIGLDMNAFNINKHPDYPSEDAFLLPNLSERDREMLGGYLDQQEKMYLLEQGVRNIADEDTRRIARAYYLERKPQPQKPIRTWFSQQQCFAPRQRRLHTL